MIPDVDKQALLEAMARFDDKHRDSQQWQDWESNKAHKYAIKHQGRLYPVKKVVSLATGLPVAEFKNGESPTQANAYVGVRGFQVVTLGRNPNWLRDELILALDLYLRTRSSPPGKQSNEVCGLSDLLNKLRQKLGLPEYARYRNPNGVYMKMMNFRALDPAYTSEGKVGLSRGGKSDEEVWLEFSADPIGCHEVAEAIKAAILATEDNQVEPADDNEEYEAREGRLLSRIHRWRERDRKIVERKKAKVLRETARLACEACDFDFKKAYGERGEGFIECHHTRPLHQLEPGGKTRLEDLALLCANCHRIIHVRKPWVSVAELRDLAHADR